LSRCGYANTEPADVDDGPSKFPLFLFLTLLKFGPCILNVPAKVVRPSLKFIVKAWVHWLADLSCSFRCEAIKVCFSQPFNDLT